MTGGTGYAEFSQCVQLIHCCGAVYRCYPCYSCYPAYTHTHIYHFWYTTFWDKGRQTMATLPSRRRLPFDQTIPFSQRDEKHETKNWINQINEGEQEKSCGSLWGSSALCFSHHLFFATQRWQTRAKKQLYYLIWYWNYADRPRLKTYSSGIYAGKHYLFGE